MNIQIQGIRYEPTADDKAMVEKKMGTLDRFLLAGDDIPRLECKLELVEETHQNKKDIFRVEATIKKAGDMFHAEETRRSLMDAIDGATAKLSKEIRRKKNKERSMMKRGRKKISDLLSR